MQKLLCILLTLGLLLSLCACSSPDSRDTPPVSGNSNGFPVGSDPTIAPGADAPGSDMPDVPDSNPDNPSAGSTSPAASASGDLTLLYHMQHKVARCYTDAGFYYLTTEEERLADGRAARLLMYMDFATQQEITLCSDASCSHNTADCTAVFPSDTFGRSSALFVWNGSLYILSKEQDLDGSTVMGVLGDSGSVPVETQPTSLYRANLDGTGRQRICTLDGALTVEDLAVGDAQRLYLVTKKVSSHQAGGTAYQTSAERTLCCLDPSTGQVTALLSLDFGDSIDWDIIGCTGRKLVLAGIDFGRDVSPEDRHAEGSGIYEDAADVFATLDLGSGTLQELYRVERPMSRSYAADSRNLYYAVSGSGIITRVDLQTGAQSTLCTISQDAIWGMVGDRLYTRDAQDHTLYFIDTATGAISHCGLRDRSTQATLRIVAETPDSVLAVYDSIVTARGDGSFTVYGYRYGLIRKEDLYAGRDAFLPIAMIGSGL